MAIIKQRLCRFNGTGYDTIHLETETSCISDFPDVATMDDLAPVFSTSTSYGVGDYVTYDGKVYRCTTAHNAGAWSSSHFIEVKAVGQYVTAGKKSGTTLGLYATAEGYNTTASNRTTHAEGWGTVASSVNSHAEGGGSVASGNTSHAEGYYTTASGSQSHAEGYSTTASGQYSHAEGGLIETVGSLTSTSDSKVYSITTTSGIKVKQALSYNGIVAIITAIDSVSSPNTITLDKTLGTLSNTKVYIGGVSNNCGHSEGISTTSSGSYSHSEGSYTIASNTSSHAEGYSTTASGDSSHAEGRSTTSSGSTSHAEGYSTTASGESSHAEGYSTTASGQYSHAEGANSAASGYSSHAEGSCTASGNRSHAEGMNTVANHRSQHVFGEFNAEDPSSASVSDHGNYIEIVGNGTGASARSNARTLDWSGNEVLAGSLTATKINAVSNENLIRNWYFCGLGGTSGHEDEFPINQRGASQYNTSNTIDRWRISSNCSVDLSSTGLTLSATYGAGSMYQSIKPKDLPDEGSNVTFSILFIENDVKVLKYYTFVLDYSSQWVMPALDINSDFTIRSEYNSLDLVLFHVMKNWNTEGTVKSIKIVATKVEQGTTQTLAHQENGVWVLNDIPDYQKELFKCQTSTDDFYDLYACHRNLVEGMAQPNENLLDNWYFVGGGTGAGAFPVNSRGATGYTGQTISIDRWLLWSSDSAASVTLNANYLEFTAVNTNQWSQIWQYSEASRVPLGKTVTFSALFAEGTPAGLQFRYQSKDAAIVYIPTGSTFFTTTYVLDANARTPYVIANLILQTANTTAKIIAMKVELGTTQTLAHQENGVWVLNEVPDYQKELFKCQTSTAEPYDDYTNHRNLVEGMARPNANLLDNWYFKGPGSQLGTGQFPINQQAGTAYTAYNNKYTIDRWFVPPAVTDTITVTNATNGIGIGPAISGGRGELVQLIEDPNQFIDRKITISLLTNENELLTASGTVTAISGSATVPAATVRSNDLEIEFGYWAGHGMYFTIRNYSNATKYVHAVKLEFGDTQTLCHRGVKCITKSNTRVYQDVALTNESSASPVAYGYTATFVQHGVYGIKVNSTTTRYCSANDVMPVWELNEVPKYQDELNKCLRYMIMIPRYTAVRAAVVRTNYIDFLIPTPAFIRQPTLAYYTTSVNAPLVKNVTGGEVPGFTFSTVTMAYNIYLRASKTNHGLTDASVTFDNAGVYFDGNLY